MTTPTAHLPVLPSGRWFTDLPPDFTQPLIAMAQWHHLPTGEVLFRRGDAPCGLYAVVRGAVSISGTGVRADEARAARRGGDSAPRRPAVRLRLITIKSIALKA